MKSHFLIVLITTLICGEIQSQILSKTFSIDSIYSLNEIKSSRLSTIGAKLDVCFFKKYDSRQSNEKFIYITHHKSGEDVATFEEINLYYGTDDHLILKNKLIKNSDESYYFIEPIIYDYYIESDKELVQFIIIRAKYPGTGNFYENYIYKLTKGKNNSNNIEKISFSIQPFHSVLPKKQGVWKGPAIDFNENLKFIRPIWNKTDGNCCPTGGFITGNFKLLRKKDKYYFKIEKYKIIPDKNE